jgi:hypothetical protein
MTIACPRRKRDDLDEAVTCHNCAAQLKGTSPDALLVPPTPVEATSSPVAQLVLATLCLVAFLLLQPTLEIKLKETLPKHLGPPDDNCAMVNDPFKETQEEWKERRWRAFKAHLRKKLGAGAR